MPEPTPQPERLPRAAVLRRRSLLHRIRQTGRRRVARVVQLTTLPQESPTRETVAFLTPRSLGNAVLRNRLRRQMREIFRRTLAPTASTGHYYVWSARREAGQTTFAELQTCMQDLWKNVRPTPPRVP